ncbi:probable glutamate carboxypeptidase PLA3 isoform X3 [Vitis riparia]|uniref:probable glutamate carboxypeptidase PLA3 isoform X3 n=1 Tax=Vitis riparia TaxID=96939 RepID=UPI00155AA6C8|nr:probable glutamate carboxypeptidase PLA3 isoform X3 [Vitis riparia]
MQLGCRRVWDDCAVQGPGFFAGATPQPDNLLIEVAKKVQDPDSESMTIYDNWMITNKVINGFLLLIYTMEEIFQSITLLLTPITG